MTRISILAVCLAVTLNTASAHAESINVGQLHQLASEQNDPVAQMQLGVLYAQGDLAQLGHSYEEAARWLTRSAEQGNTLAQYNLGLLFEQGRGVPQSYTEAAAWYERAAAAQHTGAMLNLAYLLEHGHGVPMAKARAAALYYDVAQSGDPQGQYNYALLQEALSGKQFDAKPWLRMAAEQDYTPAMYSLGLRLLDTTALISTAMDWLTIAAHQQHVGAQVFLGNVYRDGTYGQERSLARATYFFELAAAQQDAQAQYALAQLHLQGISANYAKATPLLFAAIAQDHTPAVQQVAKMVKDLSRHTLTQPVTLYKDAQHRSPVTLPVGTQVTVTTTVDEQRAFVFEPARRAFGFVSLTPSVPEPVVAKPPTVTPSEPMLKSDEPTQAVSTSAPDSPAPAAEPSVSEQEPAAVVEMIIPEPPHPDLKGEAKYNAFTPGHYRVRRGPVNLRTKDLPDATIVGQVEQGDVVEFLGYRGYGWAQIRHPDSDDAVFMMVRVLDPVTQ